jgi:hypothetical protein
MGRATLFSESRLSRRLSARRRRASNIQSDGLFLNALEASELTRAHPGLPPCPPAPLPAHRLAKDLKDLDERGHDRADVHGITRVFAFQVDPSILRTSRPLS